MKHVHAIRFVASIVVVVAGLAPGEGTATAAVFEPAGETIRISVNPHPQIEPICVPVASLERLRDGSVALTVRTLDTTTGEQHGETLVLTGEDLGTKAELSDVLVSTVFAPGSVLVLDADRAVHVLPLTFRDDHTPFVDRETPDIIGPLGPADAGSGTVLGEVPNPDDTAHPFLTVGTSQGNILVVEEGVNRVVTGIVQIPGDDPIRDLGAVASGDRFAAGAVANGRLVGVEVDVDPRTAGPQSAVSFTLRDPRDVPLIDFGAPRLTRESRITDGTSNTIVTANGTTEIATAVLPTDPFTVLEFDIVRRDQAQTPVKQVVLGSITLLPGDGTGVLYNRAFTVTDGFAGRIWTIAGASMTVDPATLNVRSVGRWITVRIEAAGQGAAAIDASTLRLSVDGAEGTIPPSERPVLLDADGDRNVDLEVKFDRTAMTALVAQTEGDAAVARTTWTDGRGVAGAASGALAVRR